MKPAFHESEPKPKPIATQAISAGISQIRPVMERNRCHIPAKKFCAGETAGDAKDCEGQQVEPHRRQPNAIGAGLQRGHGVASGKKGRQGLSPFGKTRKRDGDTANNQHGQKNTLPQSLHCRNVVSHRRDHQTNPEQCERNQRKCREKFQRVRWQTHADDDRQGRVATHQHRE